MCVCVCVCVCFLVKFYAFIKMQVSRQLQVFSKKERKKERKNNVIVRHLSSASVKRREKMKERKPESFYPAFQMIRNNNYT